MKTTHILPGLFALSIAAPFAAADYRWDLVMAGATATTEHGDAGRRDGEADALIAGATFFFNPVRKNNGPIAQQSFIERSSSIYVSGGAGNAESQQQNGDDFDTAVFGAGGRLALRDVGLVFEIDYLTAEFEETNTTTKTNIEVDDFSGTLGYYILPTTEISLEIGRNKVAETGSEDEDADYYVFAVKHLDRLPGKGGDILLEASFGEISPDVSGRDDIETFSASATWYINRQLGIGGSYDMQEDDTTAFDDNETWTAFAEYFITEHLAVGFSYAFTETDDGTDDPETDTFTVYGSWRI